MIFNLGWRGSDCSVLFDFFKAFDSMSHDLLLHKLSNSNLGSRLLLVGYLVAFWILES
jgi:hypothetical protein